MTDDLTHPNAETDSPVDDSPLGQPPQYGVGPFSVREVALIGVWLVAFIVSFFSVASEQAMSQLLFGGSVWTNGLDWILTIGVPSVAVFLLVLRRFSPEGIRRVGSLGIDQFASVAFSVSLLVWLALIWRNVAVAVESGIWLYGWVTWVEGVLMLAGVVLTVFAPIIPVLREDFLGRREVAAHRSARPIRPVSPRPDREPRPVIERTDAEDERIASSVAYAGAAHDDLSYDQNATADLRQWMQDADDRSDDLERDTETAVQPAVQQAFWALSPEERDVVDERGVPLFQVGPTAWALVIEDRGEVFVVRHEDGRIGYLHDVSDVTRG